MSFPKFTERRKEELCRDTLGQVVDALQFLQEAYRFTHWDLHSENVLTTPDPRMPCGFRAMLYDFGFARFELHGKTFTNKLQDEPNHEHLPYYSGRRSRTRRTKDACARFGGSNPGYAFNGGYDLAVLGAYVLYYFWEREGLPPEEKLPPAVHRDILNHFVPLPIMTRTLRDAALRPSCADTVRLRHWDIAKTVASLGTRATLN